MINILFIENKPGIKTTSNKYYLFSKSKCELRTEIGRQSMTVLRLILLISLNYISVSKHFSKPNCQNLPKRDSRQNKPHKDQDL